MTDIIIEKVEGHNLADVRLVGDVHEVLNRHYPGYTWVVGLNDEGLGGVMSIMNMDVNMQILGNPSWGYVLKLSTVYQDPSLKCVVKAGGAILESAGLSRNGNKCEVVKKIDGLPNKYGLLNDMVQNG